MRITLTIETVKGGDYNMPYFYDIEDLVSINTSLPVTVENINQFITSETITLPASTEEIDNVISRVCVLSSDGYVITQCTCSYGTISLDKLNDLHQLNAIVKILDSRFSNKQIETLIKQGYDIDAIFNTIK